MKKQHQNGLSGLERKLIGMIQLSLGTMNTLGEEIMVRTRMKRTWTEYQQREFGVGNAVCSLKKRTLRGDGELGVMGLYKEL